MLVITVFCVICVICLGWWLAFDPVKNIKERIPGMDGRVSVSSETVFQAEAEDSVLIGEYFKEYSAVAADLPGLWPRFRGFNSDNVCTENVPLADK